jgi:co-chaperonin GroES (HSP10)
MMMIKTNDASYEADLIDAFPVIDAGATPLGARVLVQLRKAKKKMTSSGILLVRETTDTEKAQNCVGKVVGLGPLAFKKRDTMESWPEGSWCEMGDFLRVPKWTGDRWEVGMPDAQDDEDRVEFLILNDHEIVAKITGNPLAVRAFV